MKYTDFLETKIDRRQDAGFEVADAALNTNLFPFQKHIVKWALQKGRAAIFADCGLGKTIMQLEWARLVVHQTGQPVLILCPLAVAGQTVKEGAKFGIEVNRYQSELYAIHGLPSGIYICNYEQLDNIQTDDFAGIVLDESSILKNFTGAYRNKIIDCFAETPYKLACTATPSPNDELEIGNHAEFLNVMTSQDMRAIYFTTDKEIIKGEKYRLKKHAVKIFYEWVSSWAIMLSKPSDIGFEDAGYNLPPLNYIEKEVSVKSRESERLFNEVSVSATDFNQELRLTKVERLDEVAAIVNASPENFIIWIKHNDEGERLLELIPGAVEVKGSDTQEAKQSKLLGFGNNEYRVLITKTKIASFGMNFQNCHNQVFASLDFSFEGLYQAIRRSYRFGQLHPVSIYLITLDTMQNVIKSIKEKQTKFLRMQAFMREAIMSSSEVVQVKDNSKVISEGDYSLLLGDCVDQTSTLPSESVDYSFFSPPFGALYVFSSDPKDMSNVRNNDEFFQHFSFLVPQLFRVLKSGRLLSIHIMQGTTLLGRDGFYSIVDFRGDIIRLFQSHGFYFHAEHMIRKDPKTAAIRTKNRQLMHGTTKKDSSIVRPGLADYILTFKKPGENKVPIKNNIPFDLWCKMAEPVWTEVIEGDTLDFRGARGNEDERHLTPTQLKPIEWCYQMWSNAGDTILCPFMGVGSEGFQAIKMKRKYIGIELKDSYFDQAVMNCRNAAQTNAQLKLFA